MRNIFKQAVAIVRNEFKLRQYLTVLALFVVVLTSSYYLCAMWKGISPAVYAMKLVSGLWLYFLIATAFYGLLLGCSLLVAKRRLISLEKALVRSTAIYLGSLTLTPSIPLAAILLYLLSA